MFVLRDDSLNYVQGALARIVPQFDEMHKKPGAAGHI